MTRNETHMEMLALLKEILPMAKAASCHFCRDPDATDDDCCEWNPIVEKIQEVIRRLDK